MPIPKSNYAEMQKPLLPATAPHRPGREQPRAAGGGASAGAPRPRAGNVLLRSLTSHSSFT